MPALSHTVIITLPVLIKIKHVFSFFFVIKLSTQLNVTAQRQQRKSTVEGARSGTLVQKLFKD